VGLSVPVLGEYDITDTDIEPLLTTNMRGIFLSTRVSSKGSVRYGFFECPLDQEPDLLQEFYRVLIKEGALEGWSNVAHTVEEAFDKINKAAFSPTSLIMAPGFAKKMLEDVEPGSETPKAYKGAKLFTSDLPGNALVVAQPEVAGCYVRIGDYVSILAQKVSAAFVVVL
jgi:hypothetical protein